MNNTNDFSQQDLLSVSEQFEQSSPEEIINWGIENYGDQLILACSFGAEDIVLLDMLLNINPKAKVFYLDTDKHFAETYETIERLEKRYNTSFIQMKSELSLEQQQALHGPKLWETNPDLCCQLRKVRPLQTILSQHQAWITGIRRDQAPTRANARKIEWDHKFQLVKLNPLASWTYDDVWSYIRQHQLLYNPLHDQNYPSIGCSVCTRPVHPGEDPRSGRWSGFQKTECGLHK